jgi:GR25 family glycosyltransferase involved in LPS biosynthesis
MPFRVNVVNLDRQSDRWNKVKASLTDAGYDPVRFSAVDPSKEDLSGYVTNATNAGITGCSMSHTRIMERLLQSSDAYAIVAEDDVVPLRPASDLRHLQVPAGVDIVHLGCEILCRPKSFWDRVINFICWHVVKSKMVGTHFYIVTKRGARKILAHLGNDRSKHIDLAIGSVPGLVIFNADPVFATTEKTGLCTDSSIVSKNGYDSLCWLDNYTVSGNRTWGYVLFVDTGLGFRGIDVLVLCILCVLCVVSLLCATYVSPRAGAKCGGGRG